MIYKKHLELIKVRFPFTHTLCKFSFLIHILTASIPIYLRCSLGLVLNDYFFPFWRNHHASVKIVVRGLVRSFESERRSDLGISVAPWFWQLFHQLKSMLKIFNKIQCCKTMNFKVKFLCKPLRKYSIRVGPLDISFSHRLLSSGFCSFRNKRNSEA